MSDEASIDSRWFRGRVLDGAARSSNWPRAHHVPVEQRSRAEHDVCWCAGRPGLGRRVDAGLVGHRPGAAAWVENTPQSDRRCGRLLVSAARRLDPDGQTDLEWTFEPEEGTVTERLAAWPAVGTESPISRNWT